MRRIIPPFAGLTVIFALGAFYILFALGRLLFHLFDGGNLLQIWLDVAIVASVGASLIYGGYSIHQSHRNRVYYTDIVIVCLGASAAMLGLLTLFHLNPGTSITSPWQSIPILTGLSSVAGFGVGIHRARANELQRLAEELEASNERFEQYSYAISHDLRQPLRTITSYLQLIDRRSGDELDAETRELLAQTINSSARMREMIDGLLKYTRVDSSKASFEAVDLEAVLDDVLADLEISIHENNADVTVEPLPSVHGNRAHLRLLFQNVLENAIKYTADDVAPRIHIDAERNGQRWQITVADNGIGIAPEATETVFELFERGHNQEKCDGTGLGLALCDRIVDRHDGDIWIDSKLGDGSTIYITLSPARDDESFPFGNATDAFRSES